MLPQAYPPNIIIPIRDELEDHNITQLTTPEEVTNYISEGNCIILLNSVCGCAARNARPALYEFAKQNPNIRIATVFAGVDHDATRTLRSLAPEHEPSSPSYYFFGEETKYLPRSQIESNQVSDIVAALETLKVNQTS